MRAAATMTTSSFMEVSPGKIGRVAPRLFAEWRVGRLDLYRVRAGPCVNDPSHGKGAGQKQLFNLGRPQARRVSPKGGVCAAKGWMGSAHKVVALHLETP
ncbi:hypothetical protein XFLAVUS301_16540 [Xanthobacter flavus]|uniref:Uncharacterized protein n=1 Tax=Xanthobacter flavus TaxID=281 RepID=A0A9W6CLS0_XANFL|nr:hypothetical protein XFLAVUS301_16540 [Xanthobacter flavus]